MVDLMDVLLNNHLKENDNAKQKAEKKTRRNFLIIFLHCTLSGSVGRMDTVDNLFAVVDSMD